MADDFQEYLTNPDKQPPVSDDSIIKEIDAANEKDYLKKLKKKNKGYLIDLDILERERIAKYICDRFDESKLSHKEVCDRIDKYDETHRMVRKEVAGSDGDMPNYTTPLSTVTHEVIHANIMNVFFTPAELMRVLPTEQNDIPKISKLSTFGNWSINNELEIFERFDRLDHYSTKIGECPFMVHWEKKYGTEIKREMIMNPANPEEPLIDPDTKEPIYQEREEPKLLYNGPKLEIFSRKDYFQPENSVMDKLPEWEGLRVPKSYDEYLREELQGKMYAGSIEEILDWASGDSDSEIKDYEGQSIPAGAWEKDFHLWFGKLRINTVKKRDGENKVEEYQELEDEFIALVNIKDQVLCSLRKNKFPLKMRPLDVDYFLPDDEGRRRGLGVYEMMEGPQACYDALYNQFVHCAVQSNSPIAFFSPMGNLKNEPIKLQYGYMYPTSDPNSVKVVQFPQPNQSLQNMLEIVSYWAQMLFGISDYSAGMESKIDPSAPAKKAELVVAQGSVRLNMIIKRKNQTLRNIFKRWFLLYKENMPPNKFMRIAGNDKDNPWEFQSITLQDFALNSIPDFELVGNVLNANKNLEVNKRLALYKLFSTDPLFAPDTREGMMRRVELVKWLADGIDESGLSKFMPKPPGEMVQTPEEENARFMQGDSGVPTQGEDHVYHLKVHAELMRDPTVPDEIKEKIVIPHINKTVEMLKTQITQQMVLSRMQPITGGQPNAVTQRAPGVQVGSPQGMVQGQSAGMEGFTGGV